MTPSITIDLETRSAADLKKTGVYRYAEDPTTGIWCAAFAIDDGEVWLWVPGEPVPIAIKEAVKHKFPLRAWNANFEIALWAEQLHKRHGWPLPDLTQWECTMARAMAMALPGALENCATVLGVETAKDMHGKALMMRMARPRSVDPLVWWDEPDKRERLYAYCKTDVEVERQLHERLMPLRAEEQSLWHLDQIINGRGVQVDVGLCESAKTIVSAATLKADIRMSILTRGEVPRCSNAGQLLKWFRAQDDKGELIESIAKDKLDLILARDDLAPNVREALELRQATAKTSVKKIDALLTGMSADGRARGLLQFHAASTGRWGGRRFQPQNLKRPDIGKDLKGDAAKRAITTAIEIVRYGSLELVEQVYEQPLSAVGDCIRGMVCARPGYRLLAADFSNIEGRVLAWLAGENWKLTAFRQFDSGSGPDLYKVAYSKSFGARIEDITDFMRQIGKVQELALGYQGGPGAFMAMAKTYNLKIADFYDVVVGANPEAAARAIADYESRGKASGIAERSWVPAEIIKRGWRAAHPATTALWKALENGAMEAIQRQTGPHATVFVEPVKMRKAGSFMWLRLPSGRSLCYPYPHYAMKAMPWVDDDGDVVVRRVFAYKGVDSMTKQWANQYAYGGLWAENITQAVARDVMAEAMVRLEAAGYPIVLSVHDEIVCEAPIGQGSFEEFRAIMVASPSWAYGLPIAAGGWEDERYRK